METVSSVVTYMNTVTKNKLRHHKIKMIGDSFLRGIRENVEISLSNKVGIYSMAKLSCELNTLLESANNVLENKGIRCFNKKLMEITKEHKQVALIEIDTDRKYHT